MFGKDYIKEYSRNIVLAFPVIIGQMGHIVTQISDSIMVGHLGSKELAASSLASAFFVIFMVLCIGVASGITTLAGNQNGEKNLQGLYKVMFNGFWSTAVIGLVFSILASQLGFLMREFGQPEEVVSLALPYYRILCYSLIPMMFFLSMKHTIDGLEKTKPGMTVSLVGNLLNVGLNYLFIYGWQGIPAYGLMGAVYATLIARIFMAILMFLILYYSSHKDLVMSIFNWIPDTKTMVGIFKLGLPIGLQYLLEVGAFILGGFWIGWLGPEAIAAHQIAITVISLSYMMATGLASTATIRISNLVGAGDVSQLKIVSKSLFYMMLLLMGTWSLVIFLGSHIIPGFYVKEVDVIESAASLLVIAAFFELFDGIQVLAAGALRGLSDVIVPTSLLLLAYWIISLPIAYYLLVYGNAGARGIWIGFLIGLGMAAILLTWRYLRLQKRLLDNANLELQTPFSTIIQ